MSIPGVDQPAQPQARVVRADRQQVLLKATDLEQLVPADHRARGVWDFVQGLDLSAFYREIESVEGRAGRPAIDPAILLTLWLYATVEGVGSARALAKLCEEHHAYQWICGGVSVEYRTLSDFRVKHVRKLDDLLTASVGALLHAGVVKLRSVAQDGMRIRASAGAASFRRHSTLNACLEEAEARVKALKQQLEDDPGSTSRIEAAARQRALEDRRRRVEAALATATRLTSQDEKDDKNPPDNPASTADKPELDAKKKRREIRASTTDEEARVMRFSDGGYRPGFNAQFSTDVGSQIIVGVELSNSGSDFGKLGPMLDQLHARYGASPARALVDGGFASRVEIESASTEHGCKVYAPTMPRRRPGPPAPSLKGDTPAVTRWRQRMQTERGKKIYKLRAATAECVNALARNRGLRQFTVRGLERARSVLLLFVLGHNALRIRSLAAATA